MIAASMALAGAWVAIPPTPSPDSLAHLTYGELRARFGPPTNELVPKGVEWTYWRVVGHWVFEASYENSPTPVQVAGGVRRYFALGPQGYSIKVFQQGAGVFSTKRSAPEAR
jgi:hypothetical protein